MFHESKNVLNLSLIKEENIKNFTAILSLIEKFESDCLGNYTLFGKDKALLTEDEKNALKNAGLPSPIDLLNNFKTRIQEFYAIEGTRLEKTGKISILYQSNHPQAVLISQEDLLNDSKESFKASASHAVSVARTLWSILEKAINDATYQAIVKRHPAYHSLFKLFKKISECLRNIYLVAEKSVQDLDDFYKYCDTGSLFKLARALHAKFIPFQQAIDPIRGKVVKGNCYGYLMEWKNQVIKHGKCLKFCLDNETQLQQSQQTYSIDFSVGLNSSGEIWPAIDDIISQTNTQGIYSLDTIYDFGIPHIAGFRKFLTGEIEFFDSNEGIFVFPDKASFRIWLAEYLMRIFITDKALHLSLALSKIATQPAHAMPSIPLEREPLNDEAKESIKQHLHRTKYYLPTVSLQDMNANIANTEEKVIKQTTVAHSNYAQSDKIAILKIIDQEILRLQTKKIDFSKEITANKITALGELKSRFEQAQVNDTTTGIIEIWLMDRPWGGVQTYESIIRTNHTHQEANTITFQCISKIMSTCEINSSGIDAMQISIFNHLFDIISTMSEERKLHSALVSKNVNYCHMISSPMMLDKLCHLFQSSDINVQAFLGEVIKTFTQDKNHSQDRFFAKENTNAAYPIHDSLATIIKKIDLDDYKSLIFTIESLEEYKSSLNQSTKFLAKILSETDRQAELKKTLGKN